MEALWQRIDLWFWSAVPFISTILFALVGASAWPIPYLGTVMPPLAFIALFYWSAHRPDLFTPMSAFLAGLLTDIINNTCLGVSALLFTCAHQIIYRYRGVFAGHSFALLWMGFILASSAMMIAQWALLSLIDWQLMPLIPAVIQNIMTIVSFPITCWILIQLQRGTTNVNG